MMHHLSQSIYITEPSATDLEEHEVPTSSCRVDVSTTITDNQISTTPSDGQLSTSTQSLKRKLPSSDCLSPSKRSSNEIHLQQVKGAVPDQIAREPHGEHLPSSSLL